MKVTKVNFHNYEVITNHELTKPMFLLAKPVFLLAKQKNVNYFEALQNKEKGAFTFTKELIQIF